jgi:hypothetical protein
LPIDSESSGTGSSRPPISNLFLLDSPAILTRANFNRLIFQEPGIQTPLQDALFRRVKESCRFKFGGVNLLVFAANGDGATEAPERVTKFCFHRNLSFAISSRSVARSGSACHRKSRTFLFFALQRCDFAVFNQPLVSMANLLQLLFVFLFGRTFVVPGVNRNEVALRYSIEHGNLCQIVI